MLSFNNVTSWLAPLLGANSWINGFGQVLPPQREFFYVGGEYQNLSVSHAKFPTELFPSNYLCYAVKGYVAFYSNLLQDKILCITSGCSIPWGQAGFVFLDSKQMLTV